MGIRQIETHQIQQYDAELDAFEATRPTGHQKGVGIVDLGGQNVTVIDDRPEHETVIIGTDTLRDFDIDPAFVRPGDRVSMTVVEGENGDGDAKRIDVSPPSAGERPFFISCNVQQPTEGFTEFSRIVQPRTTVDEDGFPVPQDPVAETFAIPDEHLAQQGIDVNPGQMLRIAVEHEGDPTHSEADVTIDPVGSYPN